MRVGRIPSSHDSTLPTASLSNICSSAPAVPSRMLSNNCANTSSLSWRNTRRKTQHFWMIWGQTKDWKQYLGRFLPIDVAIAPVVAIVVVAVVAVNGALCVKKLIDPWPMVICSCVATETPCCCVQGSHCVKPPPVTTLQPPLLLLLLLLLL